MGIKRLNKFLAGKDLIKKHDNINDFIRNNKEDGYKCFNTRNKTYRIGVDFLLYAYKFKYSYDHILIGFIKQITNFLSNKILPIYVIDGLAPIEKTQTINLRNLRKINIEKKLANLYKKLESDKENKKIMAKINKLKKMNIKIEKKDINQIIELFNIMNVPYIRAKHEADILIGTLYKKNKIDACLSEDMDIIVHGCKKMISFKKHKIYEYNLEYILNNLNLSYEKFVEMCIFFGCDYIKPIHRLDEETIYNYIKCNDIKSIIKNIDPEKIQEYKENFNLANNIFHMNSTVEIKISKNKISKIDFNDLKSFIKSNLKTLIPKNFFNKLNVNINYINNLA